MLEVGTEPEDCLHADRGRATTYRLGVSASVRAAGTRGASGWGALDTGPVRVVRRRWSTCAIAADRRVVAEVHRSAGRVAGAWVSPHVALEMLHTCKANT